MKQYNAELLDRIWSHEAESYNPDMDRSPDYLAHFEVVSRSLGNLSGKKILDLGCGTGITSAYLAGQGARLVLVDISRTSLNFARRYFRRQKLKGEFIRGDMFRVKLPPSSFDVVWNGGVIEHFTDKEKIRLIKIMWKLLKPGGQLLITAPNFLDLPFMAAKQLLLIRKKWAFGFEDDLTSGRLLSLARRAGIRTASAYAYNPVVGWWFFPYGREITGRLGLNTVAWHVKKSVFGHNIVLKAVK